VGLGTSVCLKKLPLLNNCPVGENSQILVTLKAIFKYFSLQEKITPRHSLYLHKVGKLPKLIEPA
jgi:hypothetical protein